MNLRCLQLQFLYVTMEESSLGPAQNLDGTLKDASEIEWSFSRDSSPVDLDNPLPHGARHIAPSRKPITADKSKPAVKRKEPSGRTYKKHNYKDDDTPAPDSSKKQRTRYKLGEKKEIIEFCEKEGKNLTQDQQAAHFKPRWPQMDRSTISKILKTRNKIMGMVDENPTMANARRITDASLKNADLDKALTMWGARCV